jgi:ankyrin repeat protein
MSSEKLNPKQFQLSLFEAARNSNWDEVKTMIESNPSFDLNTIDRESHINLLYFNHSLILIAVMQGNVEALTWLVKEKGVSVYAMYPSNGDTVLLQAARSGNLEIVRVLLENIPSEVFWRNSYLNHTDRDGYTALHHAAARGDLEMVKVLIEHGAKIQTSQPYPFGHYSEEKAASWAERTAKSALKIAEENGRDEVVEHLKGIVSTKGAK